MLLIPWTYNTWSEYEHLYNISTMTYLVVYASNILLNDYYSCWNML